MRTLSMPPSDATTGIQLLQQGRLADALPYLERANRAAPTNLPVLDAFTKVLLSTGRAMDAVTCFQVAASLLPEHPGVLTGWAHALVLVGQRKQARILLERALRLHPDYADAGGFLAVLLREAGDADAACGVLQPLLEKYPEHADLLWQFALALVDAERLQEGQAAYERYRILQPQDAFACVALGRLAVTLGQSRRALEHFQAALQIDADNAAAIWGLAEADGGMLDPETLARVQRRVRSEQDKRTAVVLEAILARHHDRVGEFQQASAHVTRVNALQAQLIAPQQCYHPQLREQETDAAIRNYIPALVRRLRGAGSTDPRPVFIIGMPRSGTTLLEQMLASHPSIVGVGEQPFTRAALKRALDSSGGTVAGLTPAAVADAARWHLQALDERLQRLAIRRAGERIVDKLPDNYMFAGWLSIAFPNAAIIHCLRDPRDVALSCWQTQFSDITWSFELGHIAHRIEQHRRLMRHWRDAIGNRLTEIRYEQLIADPETQIRRALAAMGLDWHPDVLDFAQRKGFVSSASQQQVRRPLHARSVGRWRDYAEALRPIMSRLDAIAEQDALEAGSANPR